MDDQLDNDLKKRITEVFENYEDTSADEGWLKLRKKYPEKAKRVIAAWVYWAPVAALLLLFLGTLWFKTTPKQQQVAIAKTQLVRPVAKSIEGKKNNNITPNSSAIRQNNEAIAENGRKPGIAPENNERKSNPVPQSDKQHQEFAVNHQKNINAAAAKAPVNTSLGNNTAKAKIQNQDTSPEKTELVTSAAAKKQGETPSKAENEIIAQVDSGTKPRAKSNIVTQAPGVDMLAQQVNKPGKQAFADENPGYKKQNTLSKDKTVNFAVYTTTYVNYAKGSSHQFNLGAGFTSDIKLTNNLQISTGMSIGQNSLSFAGQPPVESQSVNNTAAFAASSLNVPRYALTANAAPAFRNYSANLVGLDIPLNLKFVIDPQKSQTYFLAGFSSGTYINETYIYSYNNPSLFSANISQVQDQSTRNSFNSFYFAKTLNFAVGTGYMIGQSRLVVEPFIKYPLEGLGSQQLRFGAGGVNLKFNFAGFKR